MDVQVRPLAAHCVMLMLGGPGDCSFSCILGDANILIAAITIVIIIYTFVYIYVIYILLCPMDGISKGLLTVAHEIGPTIHNILYPRISGWGT